MLGSVSGAFGPEGDSAVAGTSSARAEAGAAIIIEPEIVAPTRRTQSLKRIRVHSLSLRESETQLFLEPAADHASMSAVAFAPEADVPEGPLGGMSPPYHEQRDELALAHVAPPPLEYAALALPYPPWQLGQSPIVPAAM